MKKRVKKFEEEEESENRKSLEILRSSSMNDKMIIILR